MNKPLNRFDIAWNDKLKTWLVTDLFNGLERQYFSVQEVKDFLPEMTDRDLNTLEQIESKELLTTVFI